MKVSVETVDGCGMVGHHHTCLCDVIITKPTPINIKDGVADMWMGREMCDIRGYGVPWLDMDIVDYFTDLLRGHDAWIDSKIPNAIAEQQESPEFNDQNSVYGWQQIRNSVRSALSGIDPKPPVMVVLQALGYTAEEFTAASSTGKFTMDMDALVKFESRVLAGVDSFARLGREFGTTAETVSTLFKYWNVPVGSKYRNIKGTKDQRARLKELVLEGHMPKTISAILFSEFGCDLSRHAISKAKSRILQQSATIQEPNV